MKFTFYCIVPYMLIFDQNCLITLVVTQCHNPPIEIFYVYLFQIILARLQNICIHHFYVDNLGFLKSKKIKYVHIHFKPFVPLHLNAVLCLLSHVFLSMILCLKWHIGPTGRVSDLLYNRILYMYL